MGRVACVPEQLLAGPFVGSAATAVGAISAAQLRGPLFRRVFQGVYASAELPDTTELRAAAAALLLPPGAAVSGASAAYLLGVDVAPVAAPLEVTVPRDAALTCRPGLTVRRALLPAGDLVEVAGVPVTTPMRTAFDLGRRPGLVQAVVALDAFTHAELVELPELLQYAKAHPGWRGIRWLADRAGYVEPATESPMETRLRLVIVRAGLPRPIVQHVVLDGAGMFCGRVDLGYPESRVGVEYDGVWHAQRPAFVADRRRLNRLRHAGWTLLHYTADDVYHRPSSIVSQLRSTLHHRAA